MKNSLKVTIGLFFIFFLMICGFFYLQLDNQKKNVNSLEGIVEELSIQLESLSTENKQLIQNNSVIEKEKELLENKVRDLEDKISTYQKDLEDLEEKNEELKQDLQAKRENDKKSSQTANNTTSKEKVAYLTFDDGPSNNTIEILDILKENNIKATFFVNGRGSSYYDTYKRIVNEGHSIGNHTYSHEYKEIYKSVDSYFKDFNKLNDLLKEVVGVEPDIIRFPGGSNNTVSHKYGGKNVMNEIVAAAKEKGYQYFDWNVSSTDAEKSKQDKDVIIKSVVNGAKNKNTAIILFHDSSPKTTTVEALPTIIKELREMGFTFKPLDKSSYAPHFL